jgi:hypothetical protein
MDKCTLDIPLCDIDVMNVNKSALGRNIDTYMI